MSSLSPSSASASISPSVDSRQILPKTGEESGNLLFTRIPVEIQMEILKYLDPPTVRRMRLVNSCWNEGVKNITTFDFKRASLSDQTADNVLPFGQKIRSITAHDLTNKRKVLTAIAPFGVVHMAEELILGERVDPSITKKLLKTATEVTRMALAPVDPRVGEAFLKFPMLFENVTVFQLKISYSKSITRLREEEFFLRKLGHWRKFPNLKSYSVNWGLDSGTTTVEKYDEILLLHAIYTSLHNFLYSHRHTVQRLCWDFANLTVLGLPDLSPNAEEYSRVLEKMSLVYLKEVEVRMSDLEGQEFWELNKTLLLNQYSLTKITFTDRQRHYHRSRASRFMAYPYNIVTEVVEQNSASLSDLSIHNQAFSFYCIEGCQLERLTLKGASIISTTPLERISLQAELEELSLDFKFVYPHDIANLMNWFPKLVKLKILDLRLKLQWTNCEMFPTSADFHKLLGLGQIEEIRLHFDASTAYKLHILEGKGVILRRRWESWPGVVIRTGYSLKDKCFSLRVLLNRGIFRSPPVLLPPPVLLG